MERRKFWWNGKWGRLARKDILLYEDGGIWWLETREGGVEGRSRWAEFHTEEAACDMVRTMIEGVGPPGVDRWRQM